MQIINYSKNNKMFFVINSDAIQLVVSVVSVVTNFELRPTMQSKLTTKNLSLLQNSLKGIFRFKIINVEITDLSHSPVGAP